MISKKIPNLAMICWALFSYPTFADIRKQSFSKIKNTKQFIAFGGNYRSDNNSEQYDISAGYKYRSDKFIHEIEFLNQVDYIDKTQGSRSNRQLVTVKNKELYDAEISSKMMIDNSRNYLNYYNRSKYDKYSDYNYDIINVAGLGRKFYDDTLEMDLNVGYNNVRNYNSGVVINPTIRIKLNISNKITFVSKGFLFQKKSSHDEELKTRISYRMDNRASLEFIHGYEKNRYRNKSNNTLVNNVNRSFVIRIKYDF